MTRYEYMKITITMIPQEMIREYNINHLIDSIFIIAKIRKGIYCITQAG